jgi:N-methylhydantoinase B
MTGMNMSAVTFEIIRNRLVAITEEMRIALQSVSGSPTVTEASDFFTGLFTPDGAVASMGFQVSYHAPVGSTMIRYINSKPSLKVRDGDMFIGNDPYVASLHQNDVQLVGPVYAGDRIIAWAGVEAHETDVGGMDFASWSPKAKDVYQEGFRIPCVKLVDAGEPREDVIEMILTASRLPASLGLDIRAFIATINVARSRIGVLVKRYGADVVADAMRGMIASSEARVRARLRELPDGEFHASDFLEHDGHSNVLYKIDVHLTKTGDKLKLDLSGSSKQAPGFINATRAGMMGGVVGGLLPTLAYDIQWNEGVLAPVEVVAPDGLICTAQFPSPVGAATVETIWVTGSAVMLALNKLLATSPKYRHRAQGVNDGVMATFNMGGVNQYGEPFGMHLMDPLAGGSAAFACKDGVDAGGPITSPVNSIADVEKNEQFVPLFYLYRRLARDTGGAGKFRGGRGGEIAITLGGIEKAMALIMTHGAEVPNSAGLGGGWPGATVRQAMGRNAVLNGCPTQNGQWERFGPKPGLMAMTDRDVFAVSWQGGGGWGDPLERDSEAVARDVARGAVSPEAAREVYGVIIRDGQVDVEASEQQRLRLRAARVAGADVDPAKISKGAKIGMLSDSLLLVRDERGIHVVTRAGYILATNTTRWRSGAVSVTYDKLSPEYGITLHQDLSVTAQYCPASGTLLCVDIHERGKQPVEDVILDLVSFEHVGCSEERGVAVAGAVGSAD